MYPSIATERQMEEQMTYAADFTNGTAKRPATLTLFAISPNGGRQFLSQQAVADKREARRVAKSLGYQPWNF
jgi:hypothetical protein